MKGFRENDEIYFYKLYWAIQRRSNVEYNLFFGTSQRIYIGAGFLSVVWIGSSPTPYPSLSNQHVVFPSLPVCQRSSLQWCTALCCHALFAVVHSSRTLPCTVCSGVKLSVTMHGMHWCTALWYHALYAVVHSSLLPCTVCAAQLSVIMHGIQWCTVLCYHARCVAHSSLLPCTVCTAQIMHGIQMCTALCYHARCVLHSSLLSCTVFRCA
jgi:hypothetical protein